MVTIRGYESRGNNIYATFLTNELTISTVAVLTEVGNKSNNEIIDYLYSKVKPTVVEWCIKNNINEDELIEYCDLNISKLDNQDSNMVSTEEIIRLNEENIRIINLVTNQKMQSQFFQAREEITRLNNLVADLAMIQLEVI